MKRRAVLAWTALLLVCAASSSAQTTEELKRMSLGDLIKLEVTTVSRTPQPASVTAAAVFVLTADDIRRSGATSIPEALRLVPGVQVARVSAGVWSIGIRGFADRLARSMLVMIDGRPVYSPLFAGTYWEVQDTLLEDVDRIEVIRGPGGTLWGANAVNGIINIITKAAADTPGLYASGSAGGQERASAAVRYGGAAGTLHYRTYFKTFDRGPEFHGDGDDFDAWRAAQGGGRADWALGGQRTLTLQGDAYGGRLGEQQTLTQYTPPFTIKHDASAPLAGGNVMARWGGPISPSNDIQIQGYYDRTSRDEQPVGERRDTADADFQQTLRRWVRHTLTWGAGYRVTGDHLTVGPPTAFLPLDRTDRLATAFVQDELPFVHERVHVTVGSKFEHNDYSGFELQPSGRVAWAPTDEQSVFAAVTRAVRTPSRVETDYTTTSLVSDGASPTFVRLMPDPDFVSEKLIAYELGYRVQPDPRLYVTLSTFYNRLTDVLSTDLRASFRETDAAGTRTILPVDFGNGLHGESDGIELTADYRPRPWMRWAANYSFVRINLTKDPGDTDVSQERRDEGLSPRHQVQAHASIDGFRQWSFDWTFRYISKLPAGPVPAYATFDVRAAYALTPSLELSVVGQDLGQAHHLEWASSGPPTAIARSGYVRLTWRH